MPSQSLAPPAAAAPPSTPEPPPHLLWLVAVAFFMQTLDATIVNTALPSMAASLQESPLRMQSVVIAYSLTMAMPIPASGWVADRFGTRRVFLFSIALFTLGSVACALSHTLTQLVASRVLQACGGSLLLPVGRLSVLRNYPRDKFLQAMSFVAIPGLIGPLMGPTLGGWLVEVLSWHWIFLINLPVDVVGWIATQRYMPDSRSVLPPRFDFSGFVLLSIAMVSISLALDGLAGIGMQHALVMVLMIGGFAGLAAYWLHALRHPQPLFPPQLFSIGSFRVGLLGNLFARIGSGSMPFLIPLLLQVALGYSPMQAGMMMLPVALASMGMKRFATPLIRSQGYRRVLVGNTLLMGTLIACFALFGPATPLAGKIVLLGLFGAVNSLQFTAMNTVTLKDLDAAGASSGNSMLSMVQMLAMSLGVTVAAALLATFEQWLGGLGGYGTLDVFRATFIGIGVATAASGWIFWQLAADDHPDVRSGKDDVGHAKDVPLD
ncbi:MAG: putative transport protein HsrA [Paracidovorax wautersii]|uniref:Putative transport protein HsrA n=1 Tax=Paracidovorax wautersii TaxID=1177982 RepID=A0A7V8FSF8_9BURK|nr:MAG: putative transport protein HsrA [Paracidovorax wautersii]